MRIIALVLAIGCTDPSGSSATGTSPSTPVDPSVPTDPTVPMVTDSGTAPATEPTPPDDLEIRYLGVGGYLIRSGGDAILTPPMYTNPDFFETTLGTVASDPDRVARFSAGVPFEEVRAILVGHAHYDHLLDTPTIWPRTDDAVIYGNATVRHILAAFAPDRAPRCTSDPQPVSIPRDRVVQLDDPAGELGRAYVDYRMCPNDDPGFDDGEGEWIAVEGTNVRFRALCSMHPDQIGPIHFAPGALDADVCDPPDRADDWVEGETLAFLIDFLDPLTGLPIHRVYYQDAPTEVPVGLFAPELLAEKGVDVALMNVGSYPSVPDHPTPSLLLMSPRYTIGGHWEDFFRPQDQVFLPILGHDIGEYEDRATLGMGSDLELPVLVDGTPSDRREWVPDPGTTFLFSPE